MKRLIAKCAMLVAVSGFAQAETVRLTQLPDELAMPCTRQIPLQKLTQAVVPIIAGRGVNLMFPKEIPISSETETTYTLSAADVFQFLKASEGSNIVPVSIKQFSVGAVRDFTIATRNFAVSLALKAETNPERHCTNILFTLTEDERKRILKEEKERYQAVLDAQYKDRMRQLDKEVNDKALLMVGGLAEETPDRWRVNEEGTLELKNGDEITAYVRDVQKFGQFYLMSMEVENESGSIPVYFSELSVKRDKTQPVNGATSMPKKLEAGKTAEVIFASLAEIPATDGMLIIKTDQGDIKVEW